METPGRRKMVTRVGSVIAKRCPGSFEMVVRDSLVVSTEFEISGRRHLRCDAWILKQRSSPAGARVSRASFILFASQESCRVGFGRSCGGTRSEKSAPRGSSDSVKGAVSSRMFGRAYGTHHARPLARSRGLYGFITREFTTPNMSCSEVEPPRKVRGIGIKVTRADASFVKQVHAS